MAVATFPPIIFIDHLNAVYITVTIVMKLLYLKVQIYTETLIFHQDLCINVTKSLP